MENNRIIVNGLYGDGMVLQQRTLNCAFGQAEPDSTVNLLFRGKNYSSLVNQQGEWKIEFNPGKAGGPFDLQISCNRNQINYKDVFVGEVWLSSGQSNAQLPMERMKFSYPQEFKLKKNEKIRMITIPISYSFNGPVNRIENPKWLCASSENLGSMSGTAYFFAKKLFEDLKVPVGIINASQGGSPITSWMDSNSLSELNKLEYVSRAEKWKSNKLIEDTLKKVHESHNKWGEWILKNDIGLSKSFEKINFDELNSDWKDCEIPNDFAQIQDAGIMWFKKEIILTKEQIKIINSLKTYIWMGTIVDADKLWINGEFCGETAYCYPPRRYEVPKGCLKEGKNTITIRVQKNSEIPVRFYNEKPYFIFTENVYVNPVAFRNVECVNSKKIKENLKGIKIDISGKWKYIIGCECETRPAEMFFEWEPTALYNSMLAPCFNHAIKGAIWYQGESNCLTHFEYKELLCKMIDLWREKFVYAEKNMPFVILQLPNWSDGRKNLSEPDSGCWPQLRNAQSLVCDEKSNTGLAVLIDAGEWNDLHPEKKYTSGTRAGIEALRIAYNKNYNKTPKVLFCERKNKTFTIRFDCEKTNIVAYSVNNNCVDFNTSSEFIFGFSFMAENCDKKVFVDAEAKIISKNEVEVYVPKLPDGYENNNVSELRYLWNDNPEVVNLYSNENIPVGPFVIKL